MQPKKEEKDAPGKIYLAIGLIFLGMSWACFSVLENTFRGVLILIVAFLILIGTAVHFYKRKQVANAMRDVMTDQQCRGQADLPPEAKLRRTQIGAEEKLHEQATAPDETEDPVGIAGDFSSVPPASDEPAARLNADERKQRIEELKSLRESGIVDEDEYRERLSGLTRKA